MREVGLEDIETYIYSRQNTVAQFILNKPILDLYMKEEPQTGEQMEKWWWEQERIGLAGVREEASAGIPEEAKGLDYKEMV